MKFLSKIIMIIIVAGLCFSSSAVFAEYDTEAKIGPFDFNLRVDKLRDIELVYIYGPGCVTKSKPIEPKKPEEQEKPVMSAKPEGSEKPEEPTKTVKATKPVINKTAAETYIVSRTYYVRDDNQWMTVKLSRYYGKDVMRYVEQVLVTRKNVCGEKTTAKTSFGKVTTGKGVALGDSMDKVLETYRLPLVKIELEEVGVAGYVPPIAEKLGVKTGTVFRYLDPMGEFLYTEFYFTDGVLHSILISTED